MYGVPVIDYGRAHERQGILVSSGCGIMMAVMDQVPLRYCVDVDTLKTPSARLGDFLLMSEHVCPPVAVCGWFSLHDPRPLRAALAALLRPIVYAGGGTQLRDGQSASLGEFIVRCQKTLSKASDR